MKPKGKGLTWLKDHIVEIIGLLAGGGLLLLVFLRSQGQKATVAPAAAGGAPAPATSGGGVSSGDLSALQDSVTKAIQSTSAALQSAEQQDVQALVAQLQAQSASMQQIQQSLQSAIQTATADQQKQIQDLQGKLNEAQQAADAARQGAIFDQQVQGVTASIQAHGSNPAEWQRYINGLSSSDVSAPYIPYAARTLGITWTPKG